MRIALAGLAMLSAGFGTGALAQGGVPCAAAAVDERLRARWTSGGRALSADVWGLSEATQDSAAGPVRGYVAFLRVPAGTPDLRRQAGGGTGTPRPGARRASAHWFPWTRDTLRYDAAGQVLHVGSVTVHMDTANVVLVTWPGGGGAAAVVHAVGCVTLTPRESAVPRALAAVPAARAFVNSH
jgi:hypothetical protein